MAKTKTKEKPKTKTTTESRILKCQLTQDEVLQAGDDLATTLDNLSKLQVEKESVVKSFKAKEAELESQITSKQLLVRNKYDYRPVQCENVLDYTSLECIVTRLDTNAEVIRRALIEEEKQTTLPFDGEKE